MVKVSVIMPAYKVSDTIEAAVQSVLNQSFEEFELLVVNDGCPERSGFLAADMGDDRVLVLDQANRGLAGARNTGIRKARGEYLAFLDSDDLWHPDKLAAHVHHLDTSPHLGVSYCGSLLIDQDGALIGVQQSPKLTGITPAHIFARNPVGNGSVPVIRRDVFRDIAFYAPRMMGRRVDYFDETLRQSEDIDCWLRIALQTSWQFEGIDKALTYYRVNEGGLSANIIKQFDSWQSVVRKMRVYAPKFARHHGKRACAYQLRYLSRRAARMRDRGFALKLALQAVRTDPGILAQEPAKTVTTLAAGALLRLLPERCYDWLEARMLSLMAQGQPS